MNHYAPPSHFLAGGRQRGAAALITVLFLLIVVAFAVLVSLEMSGSDVSDSAYQHNSVSALFLAESALETATYNYTIGGCSNAGIGASATPISLGNGGFLRTSATVVGANCQIRVSGTVGNVTRTADGSISMTGGGAIIAGTPGFTFGTTTVSLTYNVPAGASILLVGLSTNNAVGTVSMTYGGTAMTLGATAVSANSWPRAQIWYLTNPPAGSASVSVSINQTAEIVLGAMSFSGANTATPLDVAAVTSTGKGKTASLTITPVTNQAWVFEVLAVNNDPNTLGMATPVISGRTSRWNATSNGGVRGAASTIGPISPAAGVSPGWSWTLNSKQKWSQAAVALRPGAGGPQLVRWTEVVN